MAFLLLVALGISWWALQYSKGQQNTQDAPTAHSIDYFIQDLTLTTFSSEGWMKHRLLSPEIKHFVLSNRSRLEQPGFTLFENQHPIWHITAETGWLTGDQQQLHLLNNALVRRHASAEQPEMQLKSNSLDLNLADETVQTSDPVSLTQQKNWIQAVGMHAWLRSPGHVKFLSQTRAYYVME